MLPKKKVKTPLIFTVAFVLVTFAVPMTLLAGPPFDCSCYTVAEVMRYANPAGAEFIIADEGLVLMRVKEGDEFLAVFEVSVEEIGSGGETWWTCSAWVGPTDEEGNIIDYIIKRPPVPIDYDEVNRCLELLLIGLREELPWE